ncbi:MAG: SHOCT domain-containing protein [Actinomycetota bacterium]
MEVSGGEAIVMYGPWDGGSWFAMMLFFLLFLGLIVLLFLGLIVVGVVFVVRSSSDGGRGYRSGGSRALEILDERFARGEIDLDEYEERRRTLTGGR